MRGFACTRRILLTRLLSAPLFGGVNGNGFDDSLRDRGGSAVVLNIATGAVLISQRAEILAKPGSAIKPFVLEALRAHGVDGLKLACPIGLRIGTRRLDCTHVPLNEPVDAHRALIYSCNNWFAEASRRLSAQDLRETLLHFGFGSRGTLEVTRDDDSKRLQALGEAGIRTTPLEMASAYRKLALRGDLNRDMAAAASVGTAQMANPFGVEVAAKTGTTVEGAWTAGWISANVPKQVVVVWLPAGSGGSDAAPVARQIFTSLMDRDPRGVTVQSARSVLHVPFEEYVAGVLAGEAGSMSSAESRKAMAVAARTWAAAFRGRHRSEGFDFCSTTHCQAYQPDNLRQADLLAVRETAGEMLWWQGGPALAYYSKDCGGLTEAGEAPYLPQQPDPWCRARGHNEWHAQISKRALHADSLQVLKRTASGRVATIRIGHRSLSGQAFRLGIGREMGWNLIRSDVFEVRDSGNDFEFRGTGAGHGVGLCQTGAAHMGEQGRRYPEILSFYFPGTTLSRAARGLHWQIISGERVRVMTTEPVQDESVVRAADRIAPEVERRIGLHFTGQPFIRVYPTVAAFRDGTAEPGWVAGSTNGKVIRLQPRVGTEILRHELMHELVEQHAAPGLPLWFQEELVAYLTGHGGRVAGWVQRYGERSVLGWITSGLPRELNVPAQPRR